MTIPVGYAQITLTFGGAALPTGAAVVLGADISGYALSPAELAEGVHGAFSADVMPHLVNTVQLETVLVKFGPDATGPSGEYSEVQVGGTGGSAASPAITYLVLKHTNLGGRAGRGRMYLPGVTEAAVGIDGTVDETKRDAVEDGITDFGAVLSVAFVDLVILHGPESPLAVPTPITSFTVSSMVATQRRRQRR